MKEQRGKVKSERAKSKRKAKLRQQEQRTSDEVRTQFVPSGARTDRAGKTEYLIFLQIHDIAKRNRLYFYKSVFRNLTSLRELWYLA